MFAVKGIDPFCGGANALNMPPGKYGRKRKRKGRGERRERTEGKEWWKKIRDIGKKR